MFSVDYPVPHGRTSELCDCLQNCSRMMNPPPSCPNTGLSEHGDPVSPHFWVFLEASVLRFPCNRECGLALCGLQDGWVWVAARWCTAMCFCVLVCAPVHWTPFCSHEGVGLAEVCNACSVGRAAQYHGPVQTSTFAS